MNSNSTPEQLSMTPVPLSPASETHLMAPIPITDHHNHHHHHTQQQQQQQQPQLPLSITPPLFISTTPSILSSQPQSITTSPVVSSSKHQQLCTATPQRPGLYSQIPGILTQHQPAMPAVTPSTVPSQATSPAPAVAQAATQLTPRHHSSGGLKKSTETSKNNSRVSLVHNPVARRCVQEVRPLKVPVLAKFPAIRARAGKKISRRNCKGVLVQHGQDFHILKLFGANRSVRDLREDDKVWVHIPEKGTIQLAWSDIETALDRNACFDDVIRVDLVSEGYVRPLPQKVGTRLRNDAKLLRCLQLDFGAEIQDCNRWLWVEDAALFGEKRENVDAMTSSVMTSVVGGDVMNVNDVSDGEMVMEEEEEAEESGRHRHKHGHHSHKRGSEEEEEEKRVAIDDDDIEKGANLLIEMFRSNIQ